MADSLGDRMKGYENAFRQYLPKRLPLIIRVDGKGFHTYTKINKVQRSFDSYLKLTMEDTAFALLKQIDGAVLVYQQSDEISILVNNYATLDQEAWFANNLQKIVSVVASIATKSFNELKPNDWTSATFDARAFLLPEAEVANYFLWRQQDAIRNAIQMYARNFMTHKECHKKNCKQLLELFKQEALPSPQWDEVDNTFKLGSFIIKGSREKVKAFLVKNNRKFIDNLLKESNDTVEAIN